MAAVHEVVSMASPCTGPMLFPSALLVAMHLEVGAPRPACVVGVAVLTLAAVGSVGCVDPDTGVVELSWQVVDRDGDTIFPGGVLSLGGEQDTCDLPGLIDDERVEYDLRMQLEVCDPACAAGCDDASCLVIQPELFSCRAFRGSLPEVPSSDGEDRRFTLRAVLDVRGVPCSPDPDCIGVPGPREREVDRGLVVDLQVYQIVVDVDQNGNRDGQRLDLVECGCAET